MTLFLTPKSQNFTDTHHKPFGTTVKVYYWYSIQHVQNFRRVRPIAKSDYLLASSRFSVCPYGSIRFPIDGFSLNLKSEYFSKICRENSSFIKNLTRITGTLHEDQYTFFITLPLILVRMRNISHKTCRENQNRRCMFSNLFSASKIVPFMR